jgi:transcriptional antiterminator RfaH
MPILDADPDQYPDDLWARLAAGQPGHDGDDLKPRWWCLQAKPRQEKKTARYLRSQAVPFYLPQAYHESRTPRGRRIRSMLPLFPSYLFLYANERERVVALQGNTLVRALPVIDQKALTSDLDQIRRMVASGLPVQPELEFPVGTRVRVIGGPLEGFSGLITRRARKHRFVALVRMLGQGVSAELEDWQVEAEPTVTEVRVSREAISDRPRPVSAGTAPAGDDPHISQTRPSSRASQPRSVIVGTGDGAGSRSGHLASR